MTYDQVQVNSIEDMTRNGMIPGELESIEGTNQQLSLEVGDEDPLMATLKLKGNAVPVEGEFRLHDKVKLEIEVTITDVHFAEKKQKNFFIGFERKHTGRIDSVVKK